MLQCVEGLPSKSFTLIHAGAPASSIGMLNGRARGSQQPKDCNDILRSDQVNLLMLPPRAVR